MFTASKKGRLALAGAVAIGVSLALAGCSSSNPLDASSSGATADADTIVIGSQAYYSNEIIAELYAQALEADGFTVDRQYQIGQRDVYIPEIESGSIDVMPEYSGNLLQYYDKNATATTPDEIATALGEALPDNLRVLTAAEASDQDSYTTTKAFAEKWGLESLADLSKVTDPLTVAANAEFDSRPYGPTGLKEAYGATVSLTTVQDSGGPLTLKALTDGTVNLADLYTADPSIETEDLVVLQDPKSLILPQNVLPLVSDKVDAKAEAVLDKVDAALSSSDLVALNVESTVDQKSSSEIAKAWLAEKGLV
ncbi:ABC transporter substrate-binding protein [Microbacteriaceae bacterium VKM Ac-2855]|nr:ABC transporter substrate-binding protein [Microbacteriaceae bacterium VKM Ac-2855]